MATKKETKRETAKKPTKAENTKKSEAIANKIKTTGKKGFQKGQSGNPSGRPKMSEEQRNALDEIRKFAPHSVDVAKQMLDDPLTPAPQKLKIIEMVWDRTYGKPYQSVAIEEHKADINVNFNGFEEYCD